MCLSTRTQILVSPPSPTSKRIICDVLGEFCLVVALPGQFSLKSEETEEKGTLRN
jgi:hypothetical protein